MLNILGGMDSCDSGSIEFDGRRVDAFSRRELIEYRRRDVGFVFQFYNLIPNLTARENVELASQLSADALPAADILDKVGLGGRLDNFPAQLSGGEQQRVAIARALAGKPKLLLCDEPTGALDYATGKLVLALLQETCRREGMTVVIVTHNSAITPIADRVIRMRSGKVQEMTRNASPADADTLEW